MTFFSKETKDSLVPIEALAASLENSRIPINASRFEAIFNGRIIPGILLHAALIGACIYLVALIDEHRKPPAVLWSFVIIAAAFLAVHLLLRFRQTEPPPGLLGACVVFCTGATVAYFMELYREPGMSGYSSSSSFIPIVLPFAVISLAVGSRLLDPRELLFAPLYASIMLIQLNDYDGYALNFSILTPTVANISLAVMTYLALVFRGRFDLTVGALVGMTFPLTKPLVFTVSLGVAYVAMFLGLLSFSVAEVRSDRSNSRNFVTLWFVSFALSGLTAYIIGPGDNWLQPVTLVLVFAAVCLCRGREILPPMVVLFSAALLAIPASSLTFLWIFDALHGLGDSISPPPWNLLVALLFAAALCVCGRVLKSNFVFNFGQYFLLGGAWLTLQRSKDAEFLMLRYFKEVRAYQDFWGVLSWDKFLIPWSLMISVVASILVGLTYNKSTFPVAVPFWKGFVTRRSAALYRQWYRFWKKTLEKTPILGELLKATYAVVASLRFFKTRGRKPQFSDAAVIAALAFTAISVAYLSDVLFVWHEAATQPNFVSDKLVSHYEMNLWPRAIGWTTCAVALSVLGLLWRETLFLFASTAFALVPAFYFKIDTQIENLKAAGSALLWIGLAIIFCRVLRSLFLPPQSNVPNSHQTDASSVAAQSSFGHTDAPTSSTSTVPETVDPIA